MTSACSLINTFGLPSALEALRWKTYIIFAVWDVVGIIVIYFLIVEVSPGLCIIISHETDPWQTKQLSLEDMDEIFASRNPKQTSFELARQARARAKLERRERLETAA